MVDKKKKYNIESLRNESTKFLYQQKLKNKLNRNEFTDTEETYNYLKHCIHEAAKETLVEKEVNKGRKTILWDAEIEKKKKNYFLNGLVQRIIMIKYNTERHKHK